MAEADKISSDVSEDGIVKTRLSSYFPRVHAAEPENDSEPQRDLPEQSPEPSNVESKPAIDSTALAVSDPAPVPDTAAHKDAANPAKETESNTPASDSVAHDQPAAETVDEAPRTATFAVRPVPPKFAPPESHFDIPAEPDREPNLQPPAFPAPATKDAPQSSRRRPIKEEALASIVAGRTFDTEEAERAFLLTLSRDQRLKYADLLHADEQLELDVERHNLQIDLLDLERERIQSTERIRRGENAFTFANQAIRALVMLNGLGSVVVLGVWGYMAATPGVQFTGDAFEQALWALGFGALATVLSALSSYAVQALMASDDNTRLRYWIIVGTKSLGVSLAFGGFFAFLAGIYLASSGLRVV